jgi:hypothetical protein
MNQNHFLLKIKIGENNCEIFFFSGLSIMILEEILQVINILKSHLNLIGRILNLSEIQKNIIKSPV